MINYSEPTLRIWRNDKSVIMGLRCNVEDEVNLEYIEKKGIVLARRMSGGGTVYHDLGNINYTLIIAKRGGGIEYLYEYLLNGLVNSLKYLGVKNIEVKNRSDIVVDGFKVSGNAAYIKGDVHLLHGTILVNSDLKNLYNALIIPPKRVSSNIDPIKYKVNNLSKILGRDLRYNEVLIALIRGFADLLKANYYFDLPRESEIYYAKKLKDIKYSKNEFILGKSYN
jgi:lipoate-protein ligase A